MSRRIRIAGRWIVAGCLPVAAIWCGAFVATADEETAADSATDAAPAADDSNPYLAPADATAEELARFIEKSQGKTASIRRRPGFVEAIVDAADRLLAMQPAAEAEELAVLARFQALHFLAVGKGDAAEAAAARLQVLSEEFQNDPRERVAREALLHRLEGRAAGASELEQADLPGLIEELTTFLAEETVTERHLRLASLTVGAANLLEDKEAAGAAFDKLSEILARSDDRKVVRYARDIGRSEAEPSALVGQTLEIAGATVEGSAFDWSTYRGKVVLVDFWATWCGPCVAELPNVIAHYEQYHDRGFEVVGISLDNSREALETFIQENKIPWVTLYEDGEGLNPNAVKYKVQFIPFPVLVDAEGKVVSVSARGENLGKELEKLLGPAAAAGEAP